MRRIVELDPKDIESRIRLARLYILGNATEQALKMSDAALALDPQNASTLALKSGVLLKLNDTDAAVRTAQQALKLDPGNAEASVVLAVADIIARRPGRLHLNVLSHVTDTHADDLSVSFLKINIFEQMGNLTQAEATLRRLVNLYPNEPAFRSQLIRFYVTHKRHDDAIEEQRAALAVKSNDTQAALDLVGLVGTLKGPGAARNELVDLIKSGGRVFPYQIALAKLDFLQGNLADGTQLLQQLIATATGPADVLTARTTPAEMYLSKNNSNAAESVISKILAADASDPNGLRLRASMRLGLGQIEDAIADLRTALNSHPQSPELLLSLGLAYERSGLIELADKALFDATKATNYAAEAGLNYVAFLRRRGAIAQAENITISLAGRNPNDISVLSALAQVRLAQQDWTGAHEMAAAIRRLDDKSDIVTAINGAAFVGEKRFDDSLALLQSAYTANRSNARPMAAMVSVYLQTKQVEKAESLVQDALKTNPSNAEALVLMGSIALVKNDPDQAVTNFEAAIKQKPKDVIGYRSLVDFYVRQTKFDDALRIVRAGLEQQPQSLSLRLSLAGLLQAKGKYEAAIAEYETLLKEQPGSMIVANNLASLLADHRTDKASLDRASALAALLAKSQIPQFRDTLGWVAFQRANYMTAISLLEDAIAALPNDPLVRYHLGMSYLAAKQDVKAKEQFDKARALAPTDADLSKKINTALSGRSNELTDRA